MNIYVYNILSYIFIYVYNILSYKFNYIHILGLFVYA